MTPISKSYYAHEYHSLTISYSLFDLDRISKRVEATLGQREAIQDYILDSITDLAKIRGYLPERKELLNLYKELS